MRLVQWSDVRAQARVVFHGVVQGVNFRANCRGRALQGGLTGWVRNLEDGSLEALFEGSREEVEGVIAWNRTSQPHAQVSEVHVSWSEPADEFRTFEILR